MNKLLISLSLFALPLVSFAQITSDSNAKSLLDEVSAATDAHEAIHIVFEYHLNNKAENVQETAAGELTLKDDQYILSFMGLEQMSDGENVWTIMEDDEEVQISEIDIEEEGALTPSNLLKLYEKGFIYQMGEKVGNLQMIELLPETPDEVDYIKIHLLIDTQVKQIKTLKQFGKNATESEYVISNFSPSIIEDSAFIFKETDYPEFEIIDLR
jgi:hypothetical protein